MKTKFNCLLVAASIAVTLFSCKKKTDDVTPTETGIPAVASQELIFRQKKVFVSSDSNIYRLVFENEYDELGRLKTENYYPDTNDVNGDGAVNSLYRREFSYADKLISTKSFTRIRYSYLYKQSGWDSTFNDNSRKKTRQKSLASYQSSLEWYRDSIVGVKSYFDFTYSTIGDTSIENSKGIRYNQASNTTNYIDKNNIIVKQIDSSGCSATNHYKLEGTGSFVSRYTISYSLWDNIKLFSSFERIVTCQNFGQKIVTNLYWTFDSQGRPTRLTLLENTNGVITKSYYKYEY